MTRRFSFDTSAFLPANTPGYQWQRYTLEMTEQEEERVFARRDQLAEDGSRTGRWGPYRSYDRWIVKKFSV